MESLVNLISQKAYKQLHKVEYREPNPEKVKYVKEQLAIHNLEIEDTSVDPGLPIPHLSLPLVKWIDKAIEDTYGEYFYYAEELCRLQINEDLLPKQASYLNGWSKYDPVKRIWIECNGLESKAAVIDFECFKRGDLYYPFMLSAIDIEGTVYSWLETNIMKLPDVVSFGKEFKLLLGQNIVAFDSQYIAEFYEDFHDKRTLDTYSIYATTHGMSKQQTKMYRFFEKLPVKPLWVQKTCQGSLKSLAKHLCDIDLDKSVREEVILQKKKKLSSVDYEDDAENGGVGKSFLSFDDIKRRIDDVWLYCLNDSIACLEVFKKLYKIVERFDTKIYLAGQLERSILTITVDKDIKQKIDRIRNHNDFALQEINYEIEKCLKYSLQHSPTLLKFIKGWLLKDYYDRIWKSASFPYKRLEDIPDEVTETQLPAVFEYCGWEEDENDASKNRERKHATIKKIKAVHYQLLQGYKTKIKVNGLDFFLKKIKKPADEKCSIPHISLSGKALPYIIGLRYKGNEVVICKNTWGVWESEDNFVPLKHPKGQGNVGNPLAKDFFPEVKSGNFTANIDLNNFFNKVAETLLWEKFDERFQQLRVVKGKWKINIRPSGTVTRRPTGELAVVLANTKPNRAGSEMKSFFRIREGFVKISADYEGQESEIFTALLDAELGSPGLAPYSVINHCGDSDKGTDIHTFVSKQLSEYASKLLNKPFVIERQAGKAMNFANQFLGGVQRIASMLYISLNGQADMDTCVEVVKYFQKLTRGVKEGKNYYDGLASVAFNRLIEIAKTDGQTCLLTGCKISAPLDARNCEQKFYFGGQEYSSSELTTRANFTIQGGGQGLIDVCLIVIRFFASYFEIPYNFIFFVHDQIEFECPVEYAQDFSYLMQLGHLFSKALMYYKFGCQGMPLNKMYFRSVERDTILRKSPMDPCVTPSQPVPPGKYLVPSLDKAKYPNYAQCGNSATLGIYKTTDCFPTERIANILRDKVF